MKRGHEVLAAGVGMLAVLVVVLTEHQADRALAQRQLVIDAQQDTIEILKARVESLEGLFDGYKCFPVNPVKEGARQL